MYILAFFSSLVFSMALVPLFRRYALRSEVLDVPGGRKEHKAPTPLFGGVGIVLACSLSLFLVNWLSSGFSEETGFELKLEHLTFVMIGSLIIFATGLIDDLFKEKLPFYFKLIGQIIGSSAAMIILFYPNLRRLVEERVPIADYIYLIVLMGWMLTVINSFNFSDNINGLSSGLAIIALLTAMVYLDAQVNTRFIVLGLILVGSILGFIPYNFPRAKIFMGDAGSLFIGYWVGVILWPISKGFFNGDRPLYGLGHIIPPLLVLGVPLYDAAFVVFMRWREGRPIYLGDNKHLSHRLVRAGFSRTEAVLVLWGVALMVGGVGAMCINVEPITRYIAFLVALGFMLIITVLVMKIEQRTMLSRNRDEGERLKQEE